MALEEMRQMLGKTIRIKLNDGRIVEGELQVISKQHISPLMIRMLLIMLAFSVHR